MTQAPISDTCPRCGHLRGWYKSVAYDGLFGIAEGRKWVPHNCPADEATASHKVALGYEVEE